MRIRYRDSKRRTRASIEPTGTFGEVLFMVCGRLVRELKNWPRLQTICVVDKGDSQLWTRVGVGQLHAVRRAIRAAH
jgi:hypothetical protein